MSPENFVYWLQGYLELSDSKDLDGNQVDIIKDHLKLVLKKETPNRNITYNPFYCNPNNNFSIPASDGFSIFDSYPQASC